MRKYLFILAAGLSLCACDSKTETDDTESGESIEFVCQMDILQQVLSNRHSVRQFTADTLADYQLKAILWAANGINRADGKRTAPSAVNAQDIELYIGMDGGTFRYEPADSSIVKVSDTDIRTVITPRSAFVEGQTTIVLISDFGKFPERIDAENRAYLGALDAGHVSQNILLAATALGLSGVPCAASSLTDDIQRTLGLPATMHPMLYIPIGHEDKQ